MKPFNLQAALAGAKLVTRNGEEVTGFRKRVAKGELGFDYEADFRGIATTYRANGQFATEPTHKDLFMFGEKPALIPFNLEAALNGAKVVTRSGNPVRNLVWMKNANNQPLVGVGHCGNVMTWSRRGTWWDLDELGLPRGVAQDNDLFMAPPAEPDERTVLVNKIDAMLTEAALKGIISHFYINIR